MVSIYDDLLKYINISCKYFLKHKYVKNIEKNVKVMKPICGTKTSQ